MGTVLPIVCMVTRVARHQSSIGQILELAHKYRQRVFRGGTKK